MYWKVLRLMIGFVCGYLVVNLLPADFPVHTDEFLGDFILKPFEFLAVTIALVIGMYALGALIWNGLIAVLGTLRGKKGLASDIILGTGSLGCFSMLLPFGIWQTGVFFCFCLLYGMISFSSSRAETEV